MKKSQLLLALLLPINSVFAQESPVKLEAHSFSKIKITDSFWKPKLEKVAKSALPASVYQTEVKTGRIRNFEKAGRKQGETHEGIYYDDSDVYKALEAIAYSLQNIPDEALEQKADEWIAKIASAQEPDGYINTFYSLTGLDKRWQDMEKHEDYCAGHLMEAGVAYYQATGKRQLLDVAIRMADHIDTQFRQANKPWVSGHEEIELALVKLYKVTGEERYLQLADWFLDQRGRGYGKGAIWDKPEWGPKYAQDAVPVKDQKEITGHAVRAMYLYTGAADVAAAKNDLGYMNAMKTVWEDVVYRNMYVTGGIGSSGSNEGFSVDYDLPNENAYSETCASVGMVFWNQRMNLLEGQSQYIDVLERSLYNAALDGLSLSGDRFFYGNPLASSGQHNRREWFGTACCPSNISRLVASVGDYIYAKNDSGIWVNLFIGNQTEFELSGTKVPVEMKTNYPWDGEVLIELNPANPTRFEVNLRIPGWITGEPVPGELYSFLDEKPTNFYLEVNGEKVQAPQKNGYLVLDREWKKGDKISYTLPMEVRELQSRPEVLANQGRVAIQRGPLVYCVEGADNGGMATDFVLASTPGFEVKDYQVLDEQVKAISFNVNGLNNQGQKTLTAIPYYTWANRGPNEMQVWIPVGQK
ncbi:glycoside hydrolase family 127 protein [Algoriphagus lacus]|uniref:Glycoside hydrolase family 127 protein n=1 Tax=Algoriphagus lacus TaxID=2056311 RepID=A0A418PWX0_9BACT|nr:beta-L-arabinofuranosidase domain-containing protein [Algoriphagus lacus]RIW18569.1 glycoside hydrolase family 127 protein [Algoriphagus lacus]